ncbi:hypothetical protein CONLIGDRAFT_108314 [Coniochaeta ligniaria NRRL 30616]|uniref:Uncharacterized protein n=1 Tax=Coniochaeta ligniaria NRRL 30616 TaxID=1408157 RepID=A0A1J7IT27_9PEZI|nr:hypothetical protein CONLIGDRAFT_108314 [Coniochaeta ligniaria NRRL 30616]
MGLFERDTLFSGSGALHAVPTICNPRRALPFAFANLLPCFIVMLATSLSQLGAEEGDEPKHDLLAVQDAGLRPRLERAGGGVDGCPQLRVCALGPTNG